MNEVVITGVGVISPIGDSPDAVRDSLLESRSGIEAFESAEISRAFPVARVPGSFESS